MNIIMLDCDGVLNCENFYQEWFKVNGNTEESSRRFREQFCFHNGYDGFIVPELRDRLVDICEKTDCRIVWSSSWRINCNYAKAKALFKAKGLPHERLIGITPDFNSNRISYTPRGVEIMMWLEKHSGIERCAVIDDDPDAEVSLPNGCEYFPTTWDYGLTEDISEEVIWYLNK